MKKFIVLLLLLVYGFTSMGMSVSLHYCCGKLKNIEWSGAKEKTCGIDHRAGSKKCCDTKTFSNKGNEIHNLSLVSFEKIKQLGQFIFSYTPAFIFTPPFERLAGYNPSPPPLVENISLNILHCVFII